MLSNPQLVSGSITRSDYSCVTALYPKGGSTRGSIVSTIAGTPSYGTLVNYEFNLSNVRNGQVSKQSGLFMYSRKPGAASLANFVASFADHLAIYHDVSVSAITGTGFTLTSSYWGFNPSLVISSGVTSSSVTGVSASAARLLVPGDAIEISAVSGGVWSASLIADPLLTTDNLYGVVVNDRTEQALDGRDVIVTVATQGYVGVQCRGTATGSTAASTMLLYTNGARPGSFGFGGLTDGATTSLQVNSANNTSTAALNMARQFRPVGSSILPGSVFEMKLNGII